MLIILLLLLFNIGFSYKLNFKSFIHKKKLELPEDYELIETLDIIKKTANHISKLISYSYIENLNGNYIKNNIKFQNIHGEDQQKIDYISNNLFKINLCSSFKIDSIISEEEKDVCYCTNIINSNNIDKKFIVTIDPVDGSSNLDNGMPTATIFSIYKKIDNDVIKSLKTSNILSCGYILYSSSINFVFTLHNRIYYFVYDQDIKDFVLIDDNIKIKKYNKLYSINEGYSECFDSDIKKYLKYVKFNNYKQRYYGCIVSDFHNILINGGIFLYPSTNNHLNGKIRLLYEAIPLSYIAKLANGESSDGTMDIINKKINNIHENTEIFIGSKDNVKEFLKFKNNKRKKYPDINLNLMFDL